MPSISEILAAAAEKAGAVAEGLKPGIPSALERAAQPNALIEKATALPSEVAQKAPQVPVIGESELKPAIRATYQPYETLEDHVRNWSTALRGFYRSDPGLPADLQRKFINGRHAEEQAKYLSAKALHDAHAPVLGDLPKVMAVQDYAITADNVAQATRDGRQTIRVIDDSGHLIDTPVDKWIKTKDAMEASPMLQDPAVSQTLANRAKLWNDVHEDMVNEGAISPERYLNEYTPMRHIHSVAKGLSVAIGDDNLVENLTQAQRRASGGGARETNLADIEHKVLSKYFQWKANKQLFNDVLSDPSLDKTTEFNPGEPPPHKWEWYNPGPGMPGYLPKAPDEEMLDSAMRTLYQKVRSGEASPIEREMLRQGTQGISNQFAHGRLIPSPLAQAFRNMRISGVNEESSYFTKLARTTMRWIIPYNVKSRIANVVNDIPVAMMGLPDEAAHPLGVLRWYPKGFMTGMKSAFNGGSTIVNMDGHMVDVSELVKEYGVGGHTMMSQMASGTNIHPELAGLVDPSQLPKMGAGRFLQAFSQGLELGPRVAAGLDALKRTGSEAEFGRVAQRSTLEYGAGAPAWARDPHMRVLSPVIQYAGLMMGRMVDLLQAQGSRKRTIAALIGLPLGIAAWNVQNEEYRKVFDSIPEYARDQSVVIAPNFKDPSKPLVDITGTPVIIRPQWNVPDQMLSLVGLGNLPSRVGRVATGRDTPVQFLKQSGESVSKNLADYFTVPGLLRDVLSETDRYGRQQDMTDRIKRMAPILTIPSETAKSVQNFGPVEGAKRFAEVTTGQSFVKPTMRGKAVMDAGMMERRQAVKDATSKVRSSKAPSDRQKWLQRRKEAVQELQRYVRATHQESADVGE